jgi:xanthine dehydrogenase YagT iron-sulfur-binding subunit
MGHRKREKHHPGLTRRGFLASVGGGVVVAAGGSRLEAHQEAAISRAEEMVRVALTINGRSRTLLVEPRWSVLYVLRERLGLTGTKVGCDRGECGACTVLLDGKPRYACLTLALEAEAQDIVTVEGLLRGEELGEVQRAFAEEDAFQCGYCTSGQIMAAEGLLRSDPDPSMDRIRLNMSGNLCRCGAYPHIFRAVGRAADLKRGNGGGS